MSINSSKRAEAVEADVLWTLAIWKANENEEIQREIIWSGAKGKAPDLITISQVLSPSLQPMQITDLSIQILQQAPAQSVSTLLTMLACCASRRTVNAPADNASASQTMSLIDISTFQQLAQTSKKSTCGRVFKKGDIVWQCRQCGKDIACVQCDPCFRKSNHIGHEVYFHRSGGGSGCCDCGDPEAWLQEGNCCDHSPLVDAEASKSNNSYKSANQFVDEDDDPASFSIPDVLKDNFRAVMDGITGFMSTYVICQVRGFCSSIASSPYLSILSSDETELTDENEGEEFQLTVHNDDVHSYDDVMTAFRKLPLPSNKTSQVKAFMDLNTAREYTIRIDKEGSQVVLSAKITRLEAMLYSDENKNDCSNGSNLALFEEYFRILHVDSGLHVSFAPLKINELDSNIVQASRWLVSVGDAAQGMRRLATRSLLVPLHPASHQQAQHRLQQNVAYQAAIWMPSELQSELANDEIEEDDDEEDNPFAAFNSFDMTRDDAGEGEEQHLFPHEVPGLIDAETLALRLSAGMSGTLMPLSWSTTIDAAETKDAADFEREVKTRVRFPFLFLEKVPLSLCIMAHPFLSKALQTAWNDLVIRYQYDLLFKAAFAQAATVLYPSLMVLFAKYRGVAKDTILRNTVQIYTANTAVESMSSQCLGLLNQNQIIPASAKADLSLLRPLVEPQDALFITNMLSATLMALMEEAGLKRAVSYNHLPDQRVFVHHNIIRQRRYGQVCRDLEYTSASPSYCLRVLQGSANPGTVSLWVDLCEALSFLDVYSRLTHAHIEREDDGWQFAMNLILELESITTHFVSCAFLSQLDCNPGIHASVGVISQTVKKERSGSSGLPSAREFDYHDNLLVMSKNNQKLLRTNKNTTFYQSSLHQQAFVHTTHSVLSRLAEWSVKFFDEMETVGVALMQTVIYVPKLVVSKSPVSIHLPLHRLLSKCVAGAVQAGKSTISVNNNEESGALSLQECFRSLHRLLVGHRLYHTASGAVRLFQYDPDVFHTMNDSLVDACAKFSDDENTVLLMMEAPLMAIVFAAQVRQGLWRRNGGAVANLAYNYAVPVLSKYYREPDYCFLQMMVTIGILSELDSGRLSLFGAQTTPENMNRLTSVAFQRFLSLATHRFELSGVLEAFRRVSLLPADHPQRVQLQQLDETIFLFFSEYLKFICQFFTDIPTSYTKRFSLDATEVTVEQWSTLSELEKMKLYMSHNGLMAALIREIVHQVLGGSTSLTQIAKVKGLLGSPQRTVSDRLLTEALSITCNLMGDSSDGSQSLSLKDAAYQLYDAEYVNLSSSQATTAFDRVKDRLKQTKKIYSDVNSAQLFYLPNKAPMNPYLPVIFPLSIPELFTTTNLTAEAPLPDNTFHLLRSQLFSPYFGEMMFRWMSVVQAAKNNQITLLGRIVQLLTLQIHCRPCVKTYCSHQNVSLKEENEFGLQDKDWLASYDLLSVYHVPLMRLLVPYFTDKSLLAESEPFYHEGLGFILYEIAFHNENIRNELSSLGFSVDYFEHLRKLQDGQNKGSDEGVIKEEKPKTTKKKKSSTSSDSTGTKLTAQQKALEKMKNAASLFATSNTTKKTKKNIAFSETNDADNVTKNNPFEGIEDSDDEQEEADVCILCKEKKENSPKGFLCFVHSSAVAKQLLLQDVANQQPLFKRSYLVVSLYGCNVYDDFRLFSDDVSDNMAKIVHHVKYGQQVVAYSDANNNFENLGFSHVYEEESGRRGDCWLYITHPVIGWVQLYVSAYTLCPKLTSEDATQVETATSLNKFVGQISAEDMSNETNAPSHLLLGIQPYNTGLVKSIFTRKIVTQLSPVSEFSFLRGNGSGGEKLHVSTCGHAMHYSCYDDFYSANYARSLNQQVNDSFWIDIEKGESLCPLCKSISNTLLPCSPTNYDNKMNERAASNSLTMDVDQDQHNIDQYHSLQVISEGPTVTADKILSAILSRHNETIQKGDNHQSEFDRRFLDFLLTNAFFCNSSSANIPDITVSTSDKEEKFGFRDIDNWFEGQMGLIRGLSLTVQCTAYSLLQQVIKYLRYSATSCSNNDKNDMPSVATQALESQSDILSQQMLQYLLLRLSNAQENNNSDNDHNGSLIQLMMVPFLCQLLGRDTLIHLKNSNINNKWLKMCRIQSFKDMNRLCRVATHLPWSAVHSSAILPDPTSVLHVLYDLQTQYNTHNMYNNNNNSKNDNNKPVLPDNTWHFCAKPLLQSDLACSLVTSLMFFTNENERNDVLLLLILAKIVQSLLEPEALRFAQFSNEEKETSLSPVAMHVAKKAKLTHENSSSEDNNVDDNNNAIALLGEILLQMQTILINSVGLEILSIEKEEENEEKELFLARYVLSSLVVFVECIVRATAATQGLSATQLRDKFAKECDVSFVLIPSGFNTNNEHNNHNNNSLYYTVGEVYRYINILLANILKLPQLSDILCLQNKEVTKEVRQWCVLWGNETRDYFSSEYNNNDINDKNSNNFAEKMDIDEEKIDITENKTISRMNNTFSGESTPVPATTDNFAHNNDILNNSDSNNNINGINDNVVANYNPFLIDAEEDFEDLDALNDVENNNNDGNNNHGGVSIHQLLRQATMDDLRTFLLTFSNNNNTANNLPNINSAVQHLVRQSQSTNEELRRVRSDIHDLEVRLGILSDNDTDNNTNNTNNNFNDNNNNTNNVDNNNNNVTNAADNNNEIAATWQETQQLNATRATRLQALRDQRTTLIRQLTFVTSLLMMLVAANDRNISIAQILSGEVNIQLAPAPNNNNTADNNANNINLEALFTSDMFNRNLSTSVIDSQGNTVDNAPMAVSGRSLWPLYGVDPCNAHLLQRPNNINNSNNIYNNKINKAFGENYLDFIESILIRNHRFYRSDNAKNNTNTEEVLLKSVQDLSHFPLRLDMFHPVVISPSSSHLLRGSGRGSSTEGWQEMRQPVRSFVALPALYTDLYTMCKFPKRLKMNKPPKVSSRHTCVRQRDTVVSETVADMVMREVEQGGTDEVEEVDTEVEKDEVGADEEVADVDHEEEDFFNTDDTRVATHRDTKNRNRFKKQMSLRDPCICLICGKLLAAAQKVPKLPLFLSLDMSNLFEQHVPGECTLHAMECSAGVGVFYLVSSSQTLLCRGGRAITAPSIYVDIVTGEAAQDRLFAGSAGLSGGENRPMYLSEKRLRKIEEWYVSHSVAKEVTRKRQGDKSVIRLNWF